MAQITYHQEWNTSNGLPTDCVYDLAQNKEGFLILGTDQGIYTFDGFQFEQIPVINAISNSLTSIGFTSDNTLWCRNFSDQVFYEKKNKLHVFRPLGKLLKNDLVIDLKVNGDDVYVATFQTLFLFSNKHKKLVKKFSISGIESIEWKGSTLVVSSINGKVLFIEKGKVRESFQLPNGRYRIVGNLGTKLIERNQVNATIWNLDGNKVRTNQGPKFDIGIHVNTAHFIDNQLFFCTNKGTFFQSSSKWKFFSTGQNHSDIIQDFQGGFWISTIENGLIYIPTWEAIYFLKNEENTFFKQMISSPKGFFISQNNGQIIEVDKVGNRINTYQTNTSLEPEFIFFSDDQNRLYSSFGSYSYQHNPIFSPFYYGKGISFDPDQNTYFGIHSLSAVIPKKKDFELKKWTLNSLLVDGKKIHLFRQKRVRDVCFVNQVLYVAYVDKVLAYSAKSVVEIKDLKGNSISVVRFATDSKGKLWMATTQQGVFCLADNKMLHWTHETNGLSNNQCKQIRVFDDCAFVITIAGVDQIHFNSSQIRAISKDFDLDNLSISDFYKNGDLFYFVTKKGIIHINNRSILNRNNIARLFLKRVKTGNKTHQNKKNQFDYAENSLEFEWDFLDFNQKVNKSIYYRLKGFDDTWKQISPGQKSVIYTNLNHGKYAFEMKMDGSDKMSISYPFSVLRPFWLTWWFIGIEILLLGGILYGLFIVVIRTINRKQKVRELLILSQLKAIRSQMNPHFLYNALNTLQGLIYTKKVDEAGTFVSMFSDHLRHTLNMSEKQHITVREEIQSLLVYLELEKLRFGNDFHFEIEKESTVSDLIQIPSMIIQPYVENAVKHGLLNKKGTKKVRIHFTLIENKFLQISIVDNGIGREQSNLLNLQRKDKPKSFATKAIENRIDLLNKQSKNQISIRIDDLKDQGLPVGTAVFLIIPLILD